MPLMAGIGMALPCWAMSRWQSRGKVLEGTKGQGKIKCKSNLGQSTIWNSGLCFIWFLPTMCSTQCPQENYFWILQRFLVELIQILFGTQWWWWCAKLSWFVKIQKCPNLESDLMLLLCLIILRNVERICRGGLYHSCSPWWGLGWGVKNWDCLV